MSALDRPDNEEYQQARDYLNSRQIKADYVTKSGHPGKVILETAEKVECDFIIMGGYSFSPIIEVALGSTVDQILLKYRKNMDF